MSVRVLGAEGADTRGGRILPASMFLGSSLFLRFAADLSFPVLDFSNCSGIL